METIDYSQYDIETDHLYNSEDFVLGELYVHTGIRNLLLYFDSECWLNPIKQLLVPNEPFMVLESENYGLDVILKIIQGGKIGWMVHKLTSFDGGIKKWKP